MNLIEIMIPVMAIGGMGFLFGGLLGFASKKFAVPVDERVEKVKNHLPGANCGGCGKAGCEAMAKAIVSGEMSPSGCPTCNAEQIAQIAKIMGIEAQKSEKKKAVVRCQGDQIRAKIKFDYEGLMTCEDAAWVGGGPKVCSYGCLGFGSCVKVCPFAALSMNEKGLPVVDLEKCVGCGLCEKACPRKIIAILPESCDYIVACQSQEKGKMVKQACLVGCIGCGLCVKQCEHDAIHLVENVAQIQVEKCIGCGKCFEKCPTKAIIKKVKI